MKKTFLIIVLVVFGCFISKAQENPFHKMIDTTISKTIKTITVDSLKKNYYRFQILDAREPSEYEVSHLKQAKLVGYNKFNLNKTKKILDKNTPIVVYCSIGYRSEKIAEKLAAKGFEVYNLYGGIFEWKNLDNTVIDKKGNPTEKVHCFDENWGVWLEKGEKVYD